MARSGDPPVLPVGTPFHERLRAWMDAAGLTVRALAERCEVSKATVDRWLAGETLPVEGPHRPDVVDRLTTALCNVAANWEIERALGEALLDRQPGVIQVMIQRAVSDRINNAAVEEDLDDGERALLRTLRGIDQQRPLPDLHSAHRRERFSAISIRVETRGDTAHGTLR
jgi:transcriptional regulator with XRE-family HTH domain